MQVIGWLAVPKSPGRHPLAPVAELARRVLSRLSGTGTALSVSPVSAEWLAEHEADSSRHRDDGNAP